ncbi:hypothetical protein DEO72_LG6g993 [Vigna unguiculata]|uniref:Uncharacterized protein n=1 Tax=Vigna unguiculata TaxID=3917 RepID=A0A4D6M7B5_VIGUN|nr:hypothetical protein DEO72_LG6g993 [Vigna unguiculata]
MAALPLCVTSATAPPLGRPRVSPATSPTSFLSSSCMSHWVLEFTPPCFTVAPSTAIGAAVTQPFEVRFVDDIVVGNLVSSLWRKIVKMMVKGMKGEGRWCNHGLWCFSRNPEDEAAPPHYATTPRCHIVNTSHHRRRRRREPDSPKLLPSRFFYHAHAEPGSSPSLSSMAALPLCVTSATAPPLGRPRVSPATSPTSFLSSSCMSHWVLEFTPPCFTVAPSTAIGAAVTQPFEVRFVDDIVVGNLVSSLWRKIVKMMVKGMKGEGRWYEYVMLVLCRFKMKVIIEGLGGGESVE